MYIFVDKKISLRVSNVSGLGIVLSNHTSRAFVSIGTATGTLQASLFFLAVLAIPTSPVFTVVRYIRSFRRWLEFYNSAT